METQYLWRFYCDIITETSFLLINVVVDVVVVKVHVIVACVRKVPAGISFLVLRQN